MARNLRALGRNDAARNAVLFAFLALFPLAFAIYSIVVPEQYDRALGVAVQGFQVAAVHLVASRVHGKELEAHRESGGRFYSRWRAAGVSLLVLPVALVVLIAVAMAFPDLPALR